jgi:hypothetical protein
MSEWDSVISVLGTLGGLVVGCIISSRIEARKEKHETEMEYRRELLKHTDDVIKPLYHLVQELWGSLAVLEQSARFKASIIKGKTLEDMVTETLNAHKKLKEFYLLNYSQIDLLLPHPLSTWIFAPIGEKIDKIIAQILQGKEPSDEFTQVINALMKYQENLKKLIGYETKVKLEDIYPFPSKK